MEEEPQDKELENLQAPIQLALKEINQFEADGEHLGYKASVAIISNDTELAAANELKKEINNYTKRVKDMRLNLSRPFDKVKEILINRERKLLRPAEEGKAELVKNILAYEAEQERLRQLEEQRIAEIVNRVESIYRPGMTENQIEAGRAAAKKMIAELPEVDRTIPKVNLAFLTLSNRLTERANDIEIEKQRAKKQKLQDEADKIEGEKRYIEAQAERQRLEKAQLEADKAARREEAARPKTGSREEVRFEVINPDAVDRSLCTPDDRKIREAIKAGATELAGIRIWKEKVVR